MIEQDGYEVASFTVSTPSDCALNRTHEEIDEVIDCILNELGALGVSDICHYAEFIVTVDRDFSMTMDKQYYLVVEGLKRILK